MYLFIIILYNVHLYMSITIEEKLNILIKTCYIKEKIFIYKEQFDLLIIIHN